LNTLLWVAAVVAVAQLQVAVVLVDIELQQHFLFLLGLHIP
jgi:biotin transporter BioY